MKKFIFILILFLSNFLSAQKSYKINTVSWIFKAPKNYVAKADNFEKEVKAGEEYLKKEENIDTFSTDDVVLLTLEKEDSSPNVIMVSYKNNSSIQDQTLNGYADIVKEMLLRNANHDYPDAENKVINEEITIDKITFNVVRQNSFFKEKNYLATKYFYIAEIDNKEFMIVVVNTNEEDRKNAVKSVLDSKFIIR